MLVALGWSMLSAMCLQKCALGTYWVHPNNAPRGYCTTCGYGSYTKTVDGVPMQCAHCPSGKTSDVSGQTEAAQATVNGKQAHAFYSPLSGKPDPPRKIIPGFTRCYDCPAGSFGYGGLF